MSIEFKKILFPLDFSPYSLEVLKSLKNLIPLGLSEVILLYVINTQELVLNFKEGENYLEILKKEVQEELKLKAEELKNLALKVKFFLELGIPYLEVNRISIEEKINLIALGAQGKTASLDLFLGGTALKIIKETKLPVLIHKLNTLNNPEFKENCFKKILFPSDFSACSQQAFNYLLKLKNVEEVVLAHIQDERIIKPYLLYKLEEFNQKDKKRLKEMKEKLESSGIKVKEYLELGIPYMKIIKWAQEEKVSLILMGSHGKTALKEMLLGSVSEKVLEKCLSSVLIVKENMLED
ncbi:MAG: universal stress protein [Armatimonadetes bacterium]|nr:universal stress protein [Armatimonadota bacterium]